MSISRIHARQIYDSRGIPTVEVEVFTERGVFRAAVPSGASTGVHEALELRDKNPTEHNGKGVTKALNAVNGDISAALIKSGLKVTDQSAIDDFLIKLDGTPNKTRLGANAILGVSMAVARAGAAHNGIPLYKHIANLAGVKESGVLPIPFFNVINGGVHAGNNLAFQEVMIAPVGALNFSEAMKIGSEVYHKLEGIIKKKYGVNAINVGAEGGFAPPIDDIKDALELIKEAISESGYTGKVKCALDCAASEFFEDGLYNLSFKVKNSKNERLTASKLTELYNELIKTYPLISIEDPFSEEQFDDYAKLTANCGIQIVGDDLLVTNPTRIATAIEKKSVNALLLKVNQIGTVRESIEAFKMSSAAKWNVMVSHRSGETEDTFIADLVVGLNAGQIKSGAPCRSERLAKYNQLLRIEEELGPRAKYSTKALPGNGNN